MKIRFWRLFPLFCCLLLGACSMGQMKKSDEGGSTNGRNHPSAAGSAFTPSSDARKDVRDALVKLKSAYPYRLTETISSSGNGQTEMPGGTRVVEFAAADRLHMKWTGGAGGDVEAITIGDKHYWYSDGKWTEGSLSARNAEFLKNLEDFVKEVKYVGPETVNGVACYLYTCTFDGSMGGQKWTSTAKFWIGAANGLPYQSDSDFKIADYGGKSHIVYEYGGNIKVERPAM